MSQLQRVRLVPHALEQHVERGQEATALQHDGTGLGLRVRRVDQQRHQRQVGVGEHELERELVDDPQLEPASQGVDRLVGGTGLVEDGLLEDRPDPDAAVGGGGLGGVLPRGDGHERRGDEHAQLARGGLLHLLVAVADRVDAGDDLDQLADAATRGRRTMLLGEARQGLLGQPEPVATLGDQGTQRDGRRGYDVRLVAGAQRQARVDQRGEVLLDARDGPVQRLRERRRGRAGASEQGPVDELGAGLDAQRLQHRHSSPRLPPWRGDYPQGEDRRTRLPMPEHREVAGIMPWRRGPHRRP